MFRKLIGLFAVVAVCSAKVDVTVYYEALCPDSQQFITQQLYPAAKGILKDYINIKWIPFGKATFETRGSEVEFNCHHGPNECYGNKVQACAIEHIEGNSYRTDQTKESLTLDYINCLMKAGKNFPDNIYPGARCAQELQISNSWRMIQECANSTQGSQLLKQYGEQTQALKPPLTSVPTVTFNQKFDEDTASRALSDFRGIFCMYLADPKPQACTMNGVSQSTVLSPLLAIAAFILYRIF